jgi:hypothetical protein
MRSAVASFAASERAGGSDKKMGGVTVVLGLSQPPSSERVTQVLDLLATAFTAEGKPVTQRRQTVSLTLRPSETDAKFEIVSRLDLKPGRYNLRFAVHNRALGKDGSVYADVDVPNYEKEPVSLSGVIFSVAQALPAAGSGLLGGIVPLAPTTQRSFSRGDDVKAFVRVYQGGGKPPQPVTVRATITDARDVVVHEATQRLDPASSSDYTLPLPVARLAPGPYLLAISTVPSRPSTTRDVRFSVR